MAFKTFSFLSHSTNVLGFLTLVIHDDSDAVRSLCLTPGPQSCQSNCLPGISRTNIPNWTQSFPKAVSPVRATVGRQPLPARLLKRGPRTHSYLGFYHWEFFLLSSRHSPLPLISTVVFSYRLCAQWRQAATRQDLLDWSSLFSLALNPRWSLKRRSPINTCLVVQVESPANSTS